jgi:hypothetical protein
MVPYPASVIALFQFRTKDKKSFSSKLASRALQLVLRQELGPVAGIT